MIDDESQKRLDGILYYIKQKDVQKNNKSMENKNLKSTKKPEDDLLDSFVKRMVDGINGKKNNAEKVKSEEPIKSINNTNEDSTNIIIEENVQFGQDKIINEQMELYIDVLKSLDNTKSLLSKIAPNSNENTKEVLYKYYETLHNISFEIIKNFEITY
jgi:hypothetical protein